MERRITESNSLNISLRGWWIVRNIVRPLFAKPTSVSIKLNEVNASSPVVGYIKNEYLIHEYQGWIQQQLTPDTDSSFFPARDALFPFIANDGVAAFLESQFKYDFLDEFILVCERLVELKAGSVPECFPDSKIGH